MKGALSRHKASMAAPGGLQPPELVCSSVSDTGQNITVSCGTWSTWYQQQVWAQKDSYCQQVDSGGGGGGSAASNGTRVASFGSSKP